MGGGGIGGGRSSGGEQQKTDIDWIEISLTAPATVTGDAAAIGLDEHLTSLFALHPLDQRPTLLYFHHDHDPDVEAGEKLTAHGKASKKQCDAIDDETVARWSRLYTCLVVDVGSSESTLLKRFQAGDGPSFAVVNTKLEVVATSGALRNSKSVASFFEKTTEKHFPEYWEDVREQLDEQKSMFKEVRSLAKKGEHRDALDRLVVITQSNLRIGKHYDDALELEKKLRAELDKR